jgi:hypothetical protein
MSNSCPKCGLPTRVVKIGAHNVILDANPNPIDGNVLSVNGVLGQFIQGMDLFTARRNPVVSSFLYRRHAVSCREYWRSV